MLAGKKIVIGITGSIAAYKIPLLVRLLVREKAEVQVIMTPAASNFVTPLTLSTLSQRPVIVEPFKQGTGEWNSHVELGQWADAMIFAPVTANTLGKMVNGIADNFVITAYLSAKCPVFIAPAMDLDMFRHPSTQNNIKALIHFGNIIIEPQTGELASGLTGPGRMEEPGNILKVLESYFSNQHTLRGRKILITAGPTYEKIDPVRFIGNFSSGKMGFSLADEAAERGADVVLISGPTHLQTRHPKIQQIDVVSAEQMFEKCREFAAGCDMIIMAAAVADFTVDKPLREKFKKSADTLHIELKPTTDILAFLGAQKTNKQILVGFALETENESENAINKLEKKNLDFIVLNTLKDPGAGFGTETNKVTIFSKNRETFQSQLKSKPQIAGDIFDFILNHA